MDSKKMFSAMRVEAKPTVFQDDDLETECNSPASTGSIDTWSSDLSDEFLPPWAQFDAAGQNQKGFEELEPSSAIGDLNDLGAFHRDVGCKTTEDLHPDLVAMRTKELEAEARIKSLESQLATQEREITECFEMQQKTIQQLQQEHEERANEMNAVLSKISILRLKARRDRQSKEWWNAFFGTCTGYCYNIDVDGID